MRSIIFFAPSFQSTPSAWRVTQRCKKGERQRFISIHTLRMEGDNQIETILAQDFISIHTLRMEGDLTYISLFLSRFYFNPHPPHGG